MKNKKIIAACVCGVILVASVAFAQDSASITVTCSIPEIPGLNAPLIQDKTQPTQSSDSQPVSKEEKIQDTKEASVTPENKEQAQIILARNDASPDVVETYYSR